jgi:hypothetical protein
MRVFYDSLERSKRKAVLSTLGNSVPRPPREIHK